MNGLVPIIATLILMLFALTIMLGKVEPGEAVIRIGIFMFLLCLSPLLVGLLKLALAVMWKPLLLLLIVVVVVTVLVRVLLTMILG